MKQYQWSKTTDVERKKISLTRINDGCIQIMILLIFMSKNYLYKLPVMRTKWILYENKYDCVVIYNNRKRFLTRQVKTLNANSYNL